MLFDWLDVGQVIPTHPAISVCGPKHGVKKGKTLVLHAEQARALLDRVYTSPVVGRHDRAHRRDGLQLRPGGAVVGIRVEA
jgi:hypothetical protein